MSGWRTGLVVLAAVGAAVPANPRADAVPGWAEYRAQLNQVLASERSPGAAESPGRRVSDCKLFQAAPERVPAQECMGCHGLHTTHPVEIDYESARYKGRTELRTAQEVVRRGVFLPDGKVQCVTCHEAGSRWASHLAIPPGAKVRPAINLRDRSTYEQRPAPSRPDALPAGTAVSPTPLCNVCHTLAD